jgi:hypothetical protein
LVEMIDLVEMMVLTLTVQFPLVCLDRSPAK